MSLPQAKDALKDLFGAGYIEETWIPALTAVMGAENDVSLALEAINKIRGPLKAPSACATTTQCAALEADLAESVQNLKERKRIFGRVPTLNELLDPVEEQEVGEPMHAFEGDEDIVAQVHREQAIEHGEIIEIPSDDDEDEDEEPQTDIGMAEMIGMCKRLEGASLSSTAESSLEASRVLRRLRAQLTQISLRNATQTTL